MTCRTARVEGMARCGVGRLQGPHRPRKHLASTSDLGRRPGMTAQRATEIVAEVAAVIPPPPGGALRHDDDSWHAFTEVLTEAARRVAAAVGYDGRLLREALGRPQVDGDPLRRMLVEMALELVID